MPTRASKYLCLEIKNGMNRFKNVKKTNERNKLVRAMKKLGEKRSSRKE